MRTCLLLLALESLFPERAWGQEHAAHPSVLVEITTPRATLLPCELATLDVTITNQGKHEIRFLPFYASSTSGRPATACGYRAQPLVDIALFAWIRRPGEDEYERYASGKSVDLLVRERDRMAQGGVRRVPLSILAQGGPRKGFVFQNPGTYAVKIGFPYEYGDPDNPSSGVAESDPLELQVVDAADRSLEALRIWARAASDTEDVLECGLGVSVTRDFTQRHGMQPFASERYTLLDTLRSEYPDTIYGQYCLYFATFQTPGAVTMLGTPPKEKYAENVAVIEDILARNPDFPLADRANLDLAEYKLGLSESVDANGQVTRDEAKAAEARAILQELVRSGKKTIAIEIARQRLELMNTP
jgi:hypothetical protein